MLEDVVLDRDVRVSADPPADKHAPVHIRAVDHDTAGERRIVAIYGETVNGDIAEIAWEL